MPESAEAMQKVKRQSISLITKDQRVNVRFFNPKNLLLFDALYYVTPNSYHPSLKSPDSIQYIRDSLVKQCEITQHQDKIFVMRLAKRGRALTNEEAIKKYLEKNGFVSVDPESLELKDQIAVFSLAKIVIGIMGAAMTNTTFCAPNTDVIYLAPEGWMEPFYWDLANVVKQRYHVIYGINQKNNLEPHEKSFEIPLDSLASLLRKIL
jgi:capsular polysaccharide biosynthesis protein